MNGILADVTGVVATTQAIRKLLYVKPILIKESTQSTLNFSAFC